jgi:hypothetical protein
MLLYHTPSMVAITSYPTIHPRLGGSNFASYKLQATFPPEKTAVDASFLNFTCRHPTQTQTPEWIVSTTKHCRIDQPEGERGPVQPSNDSSTDTTEYSTQCLLGNGTGTVPYVHRQVLCDRRPTCQPSPT